MKVEQQQKSKSKYNGFITPNKNYIWAGAMALAWQELKNQVIKQPIKLQTKDHQCLQIIDNFNTSNFLKKDLLPECYYVKSGFGKQTASLINKQVKSKFKHITLPNIQQIFQKTDLISYAYIFKKFDFLLQFERRQNKIFEFNGVKVDSFYAKKQQQKKNVFYTNYEDDQNFVIGIKGKNQNDSIFLLKQQKDLIADQVIKTIIYNQNKGFLRYLTIFDEFQMPVVNIQVARQLTEIQGLKFKNKSCEDCYLAKAVEGLKFQINQKGAKMQNFALLVRKKAKLDVKNIKRFLLNKTFWIIMKQKGKHPYLCMKICAPVEVSKSSKKQKSL